MIDQSIRKDGTWSRSDFEWDEENDQYICPEGHALRQYRRHYSDPERGKSTDGRRKYRCLKLTCQACPSKPRCCPNADARHVTRGTMFFSASRAGAVSFTCRSRMPILGSCAGSRAAF